MAIPLKRKFLCVARFSSLSRSFARVPLRVALTIPLVVLIVGTTLLVGCLSYWSGQGSVENLGQQLVAETNARVIEKLETYVKTPFLINQLNVDAVEQGHIDLQDGAELETALLHRLRRFDQVSALIFTSPEGRTRVLEQYPEWYLGRSEPSRPDFLQVYRLDSQGNPQERVATDAGFDVRRDRPWYREAVRAGQPIWSAISRYGTLETLTLTAAQPLYNPSTKALQGVFAAHLRLNYLNNFLRHLDISRSGQILITDTSGALIATSTQEKPYWLTADKVAGVFQQLNLSESQDGLTRSLGLYLDDHANLLKFPDQTRSLEFFYQGEPEYVRISPFQDEYGLDWRIITIIPKAHFLQPIQDNTRTTILFSLLTLAIAIGLGIFAANGLTDRFAQIAIVSRKLARGDLDQRLPTAGWIDELNDLSRTFNQMADQIQQSFDQIKTALAESQEKFTTIFRTSPEPITIASLSEGRILEVNHSLTQFFGYSEAEMIGKTAVELRIWHDLEQRQQYRALLEQQGSVRNLEVQLRNRAGQVKTVLLSAEVRTLEGQERIILVHRDISDRKAAELALQQSEARYRAIVEDQSELICRSLPDTSLTFINDAYCRYFGVQREDIIGRSYRSLIYQPEQEDVLKKITQMSWENPVLVVENRVVVRGQVRWMQWIDRLLFDSQGNPTEVQSVGRDITALKQTEEALRRSEASLLQAQQIAHLGSWELDLNTQKLIGSEELFRITGRDSTQTELSRSDLNTLIPATDRDLLEAAVKRAIAQGTAYEVEHRVCRPDGTVRFVVSKGQTEIDDQQQVVKLFGTVLDITDRKNLERSLRSQAEEAHLLATITQNIRQSLDLEQILSTTVVEVQQTLNADRALIFRLNSDGSGQVIREAVLPQYPTSDQMRWEDEHFPGECYAYYQQGIPRIVPDVTTDVWANCLVEFLQGIGVKSKIVAPILQVRDQAVPRVWGLLVVHACSYLRQWQESEANFLQKICNQLAIAIDQANLYHALQMELAERKQTEAALRQSEARLALAQHVAQVGDWEWDLESQQRTWSEFTFRHWGRDPALREPSYAELLEMVHPGDRVILQQKVQSAIVQGMAYSIDVRVVHPDRSVHYLECRVEPVPNETGQIVKLIGTSLDITERKQTEQNLQERETMLRAIGDNLPKGFIYQIVYEPDKSRHFTYISAGIERLLGLKPEDVLQNPELVRTVGFNEDLTLANQIVQEALDNLTPIEIQMRNRTPDGEIQWSSIREIPRRLEAGRTVWDGIEVDITDLKRIESALRESEERFRRAFDDAPIGISLVSPTGQFVKVNISYCNLVGYTEAELLALNFRDITHPDDIEADQQGFQQMLNGEISALQMQKRFITRQGSDLPVLLNAAPIRNQEGELLYIVGHIQDIRERLKIERMKQEFISVVSHELRTPLTSIRGALGLLESGIYQNRPEKARHMLQIAINSSERLVRLVNDILALERLESSKVELVKELCEVTDLVQQAVDSVQSLADQSAIALSIAPISATLWAAPDAVIQVLTNLLSNAIKFSAEGSTVWLSTDLKHEGTPASPEPAGLAIPHLLFVVRDQGRGIPEDKLEVIFEQFQQVDVSDSRKKGGTGLGLTICKKIVQQHSGQIWVKSCLGEGSTFYVALPLNESDA